ncbi:Methionyl-tRNA formyltransferase [Coemansia sp. RSA 2559]|nr:Methionyl-tRNA formyltransferase [Coemansia sp. RSA 2559]
MNALFVYARHVAPAAKRAQRAFLLLPQRQTPALAASLANKRSFASTVCRHRPLNVLFFGIDEYDVTYLKALLDERSSEDSAIGYIEVVTVHPKEVANQYSHVVKWAPPVEKVAKDDIVRVHTATTEKDLLNLRIRQPNGKGSDAVFDVGIVCGYPHILPPYLAKMFPLGCYSIHNSLLPKYRGPSPVETAILNNDKVTGVTISEYSLVSKDVGKILAQVPVEISQNPKRKKLLQLLCNAGAPLLIKALRNLQFLRKQALEQNESEASYTEDYDESFCKIIWEKTTAEEIERKSRAFQGKYFMHTNWLGKKMRRKISLEMVALPTEAQKPLDKNIVKGKPGTLFYDGKANYLETLCIDRNRLIISRIRIFLCEASGGLKFQKRFLKRSGSTRLLTEPVDEGAPAPPFVYPPGTEPEETQPEAQHEEAQPEAQPNEKPEHGPSESND